ncbi:hypothetical protein EXIGLDRAFT_729313 [Exidia glandulosa HHB12029]|uniref:F-box domain-containing protein n=1 Tax=Exidia glandulosa HHB12029 TaxID=1314781 RepID=A0A165CMY2_EXIGL|nr:hypothetical protein EXIGLDRAFT_729313 [Exidia glandulosa HHB12029]
MRIRVTIFEYGIGWDVYERSSLRVLGTVRLAFPHLTHLDISLYPAAGAVFAALCDTLQEPAPVLESLVLSTGLKQLPSNFLGATAPKLHSIHIEERSDLSLIPIFPEMHKLSIIGSCDSISNLAIKFPCLAQLTMKGVAPSAASDLPLDVYFPALKTLHLHAWASSHVPFFDLAEQTRHIRSVLVVFDDNAMFEDSVPSLVQCLRSPLHLSFSRLLEGDREYSIQLRGGEDNSTPSRTFLRGAVDVTQPGALASVGLLTVVQSVASQVTRLNFDYLLLPFVVEAASFHLTLVRRVEVDLRRLPNTPRKRRARPCYTHNLMRRHTVNVGYFEKHRAVLECSGRQLDDATDFTLVLVSHAAVWFPAHEILHLAGHFEAARRAQSIKLVLVGVIEEPEDAALLRTVCSQVTYRSGEGVAPTEDGRYIQPRHLPQLGHRYCSDCAKSTTLTLS